MINDSLESPSPGTPPRMDPEHRLLSRARAQLARQELESAEASLRRLLGARAEIAARARVQLARVRAEQGDSSGATTYLSEAATLLDELLTSCGARLDAGAELGSAGGVADAEANALEGRAALLELGRAWTRLGHPKRAREAYAKLLHHAGVNERRSGAGRHSIALAEYRLGELLVGDEPSEAYEHWRRAFKSGDEEVSPYAALRMATEEGIELVTGRVELLFRHAMRSSDPRLSAEAALGLGLHLRGKRQLAEARRYLKLASEQEADPERARKAAEWLTALDWEETAREGADHARLREVTQGAMRASEDDPSSGKDVIVVGAGTGGDYLVESLEGTSAYRIIGFVDDKVSGFVGDDAEDGPSWPVFGGIDQLPQIIRAQRPDEVLLAIPTLAGSRRRAVVKACRDTSTPLLNLPRMHKLGIGWRLKETRRRLMTQLRPVEIEEMLGERRVEIDAEATAWLQYEPVVVVGAGALGAEICRRLADGDAGRIVVVDRRPSALRKIVTELADSREFGDVDALVGDATDSAWMTKAFRERSPVAVINTTGHSPIAPVLGGPLRNPDGGRAIVRNEVLAAAAVASAAAHAGVPRMVHVSSKPAGVAHEPFEAMKALCEEIVLWHAANRQGTVQAVVRIGQLLDSRHGRLERLKRQIETGAKVKIPAGEARVPFLSTARYAELVLHVARLAANGALLEPGGGEEIVVRDVAEQAIRLRGLYPDEHVRIEECSKERWDDPCSPEPRRELDPELGIFQLVRRPASDASLEAAFKACAALVEEYGEGGPMAGGEERGLVTRAEGWLGPAG
jgi:FlaA1/EpsC-like NDP-sugar epimerase